MENKTKQFETWNALMQGGSAVEGTNWSKRVTVIGSSTSVGWVTVKDDSGEVFKSPLYQLHKIS